MPARVDQRHRISLGWESARARRVTVVSRVGECRARVSPRVGARRFRAEGLCFLSLLSRGRTPSARGAALLFVAGFLARRFLARGITVDQFALWRGQTLS